MKPLAPPAPLKFVTNINYGESNPPPQKKDRMKNAVSSQPRRLQDEAG